MQGSNQEPSQEEGVELRIQDKPLDKQDISSSDDVPRQGDPNGGIFDEPLNEGDL